MACPMKNSVIIIVIIIVSGEKFVFPWRFETTLAEVPLPNV